MSRKDRVSEGFEPEAVDAAAADEKRKEAKREAAKRFNEKRRAEKEGIISGAKAFIAELQEKGIYSQLSGETQAFVSGLASLGARSGHGSSGFFAKLFGGQPAAGASVTLREAFEKTLKGKPEIDAYVKKWAKSGIVVEYIQNDESPLDSVYKVVSVA